MNHPELGQRILDQVVESVEHLGRVEIFPRRDGRNMTMVLAPDRKAQAANERAKRQTDGAPTESSGSNGREGGGESRAPAPGPDSQRSQPSGN
jgi:translation initiation factor IF-3